MSTLKVNTINAATSGQAVTVDIKNPKTFRNLIINGAMEVAQRGTSTAASSQSASFNTVDRWKMQWNNLGVNATETQGDIGSSDAPYDLGFRKYHRFALASAGTANAGAYVEYDYGIEARDMATSGWDYTSASSFITLSFWFRPSTNQTFYATLESQDGTKYAYTFSFTATANNTWTKVTHSIPGNANLQFNNDNGPGWRLYIIPFFGTTYTDSVTLNSYRTFSNSSYCPDMATTWVTAGASTFDVTGVQLEVGSYATDFEHRSYADELNRCLRYFYAYKPANSMWRDGWSNQSIYVRGRVVFPVPMRDNPSAAMKGSISHSNNESGGDNWSENPTTTIYEASANVRSASSDRTYTFWTAFDTDAAGNSNGIGFHFASELV